MNAAANMVAVLTLMLDDPHAAAQYINALPQRDAYALAGFATSTVAGYLREVAKEEGVDVFVLLQRVALKAAATQ
jgi:hypothetical protein